MLRKCFPRIYKSSASEVPEVAQDVGHQPVSYSASGTPEISHTSLKTEGPGVAYLCPAMLLAPAKPLTEGKGPKKPQVVHQDKFVLSSLGPLRGKLQEEILIRSSSSSFLPRQVQCRRILSPGMDSKWKGRNPQIHPEMMRFVLVDRVKAGRAWASTKSESCVSPLFPAPCPQLGWAMRPTKWEERF